MSTKARTLRLALSRAIQRQEERYRQGKPWSDCGEDKLMDRMYQNSVEQIMLDEEADIRLQIYSDGSGLTDDLDVWSPKKVAEYTTRDPSPAKARNPSPAKY